MRTAVGDGPPIRLRYHRDVARSLGGCLSWAPMEHGPRSLRRHRGLFVQGLNTKRHPACQLRGVSCSERSDGVAGGPNVRR
jgi:hypothetical protein